MSSLGRAAASHVAALMDASLTRVPWAATTSAQRLERRIAAEAKWREARTEGKTAAEMPGGGTARRSKRARSDVDYTQLQVHIASASPGFCPPPALAFLFFPACSMRVASNRSVISLLISDRVPHARGTKRSPFSAMKYNTASPSPAVRMRSSRAPRRIIRTPRKGMRPRPPLSVLGLPLGISLSPPPSPCAGGARGGGGRQGGPRRLLSTWAQGASHCPLPRRSRTGAHKPVPGEKRERKLGHVSQPNCISPETAETD